MKCIEIVTHLDVDGPLGDIRKHGAEGRVAVTRDVASQVRVELV